MQTAKRLLSDSPELLKGQSKVVRSKKTAYDMAGALNDAIDLARPRDRGRAWHHAHAALLNAIVASEVWAPRGKLIHTEGHMVNMFNDHPDTSKDDALKVFEAAIKSQGRVNAAVKAMGE